MITDEERHADRWIAAAVLEHSSGAVVEAVQSVAAGLSKAEAAGLCFDLQQRRVLPLTSDPSAAHSSPSHALAEFLVIAEQRNTFGDEKLEARCLYGLGLAYFFQGDLLRSFRHLYRSAELFRALRDEAGLITVLRCLAAFGSSLGSYTDAAGCLTEALFAARRLARMSVEAEILVALGVCKTAMGERESVVPALRTAIEMAETFDLRAVASSGRIALAEAYRAAGAADEAVAVANTALAAARRDCDAAAECRALVSLGRAYLDLGDEQDAEMMEEAAHLLDRCPREDSFATLAFEIGSYYLTRNNLSRARSLFDAGLARAVELDRKADACQLRRLLAVTCAAQGDLSVALEYHDAFQRDEQHLQRHVSQCRILAETARRNAERERREVEVGKARVVESERLRHETFAEEQRFAKQMRGPGLARLPIEDALTGVYNRRYLNDFLEMEMDRVRREEVPLSVTIADIDDFRQINDCFSHRIGDSVLRTVAEIFASYIRSEDIVARYGGEEFVAVLPGADRSHTAAICERIRSAVEDFPWDRLHPELRVTISIGVADERTKCVEDLLYIADQRLGQAKRNGKNRLV